MGSDVVDGKGIEGTGLYRLGLDGKLLDGNGVD